MHRLKSVILAIENTRGTAPAANKFYKMPVNGQVGLHVEQAGGSEKVLGDGRIINEEFKTMSSVSGDLPITANYANIYFPLALGFGLPDTVTDNADGTYTRVFVPKDCLATASIQRQVSDACGGGDFYELFTGVAVDGWSINVTDEKLKVPMNCKGGKAADSNDQNFTPIDVTQAQSLTEEDMRKTHVTLKKGGNLYKLSSNFTIQIGNSVQEQWLIGDGEFPSGLEFGAFTVGGSVEGLFDAAFLGEVKSNGRADFEIAFTSQADSKVKLVFTLTNVYVKYKTDPFPVGEKVTLALDWTADIHSTVQATLTNKVQTY